MGRIRVGVKKLRSIISQYHPPLIPSHQGRKIKSKHIEMDIYKESVYTHNKPERALKLNHL